MKKFLLASLLTLASFNTFAAEGHYVNVGQSESDFALYKTVDISQCGNFKPGFIARFYGASPFNFCEGADEVKTWETKKCLGKTLPYPFGNCIGPKRKQVFKSTKEVINSGNTHSIIEKNFTDGEITFEQEYTITDLGAGKLTVEYSFQSYTDGRSGKETHSYEKAEN